MCENKVWSREKDTHIHENVDVVIWMPYRQSTSLLLTNAQVQIGEARRLISTQVYIMRYIPT